MGSFLFALYSLVIIVTINTHMKGDENGDG